MSDSNQVLKAAECDQLQINLSIEELLTLVVTKVVDFPEDVQLTVTAAKSTTIIEIAVNDQDKPKLIGRQGRTMNAIRTLISAMGGKKRRRYQVELLDDDRYTRTRNHKD